MRNFLVSHIFLPFFLYIFLAGIFVCGSEREDCDPNKQAMYSVLFHFILITVNWPKQAIIKPKTSIGEELHLVDAMKLMNRLAANWKPVKVNGKPTSEPKVISVDLG
jgi:hypothetical protein